MKDLQVSHRLKKNNNNHNNHNNHSNHNNHNNFKSLICKFNYFFNLK